MKLELPSRRGGGACGLLRKWPVEYLPRCHYKMTVPWLLPRHLLVPGVIHFQKVNPQQSNWILLPLLQAARKKVSNHRKYAVLLTTYGTGVPYDHDGPYAWSIPSGYHTRRVRYGNWLCFRSVSKREGTGSGNRIDSQGPDSASGSESEPIARGPERRGRPVPTRRARACLHF